MMCWGVRACARLMRKAKPVLTMRWCRMLYKRRDLGKLIMFVNQSCRDGQQDRQGGNSRGNGEHAEGGAAEKSTRLKKKRPPPERPMTPPEAPSHDTFQGNRLCRCSQGIP